jgi:hypothetical protein
MERFLTTAKRERPEEPLAVKLSVKDQTPDARKKVARDTKPGGECTAAGRSPHGAWGQGVRTDRCTMTHHTRPWGRRGWPA